MANKVSECNYNYLTKVKVICVIFCGVLLTIGSAGKQLTPEMEAYDSRILSQPTTFSLPNDKAEQAWSRAHHFIATLSSFRIQTATDYVIQTYMMKSSWPKYGYSVTRTTNNNNTIFTVNGYCTNAFSGDRANYNAHALAYYMVSGELMNQRVNK